MIVAYVVTSLPEDHKVRIT